MPPHPYVLLSCQFSLLGFVPLVNFLSEKKKSSYTACLIQCYFFIAMVITEYYMLAVMAYDRYMAICNPSIYSSKMSKGVCIHLIAGPYTYGLLVA